MVKDLICYPEDDNISCCFYSSPYSEVLEFHQYDDHRLLLHNLQLNIH